MKINRSSKGSNRKLRGLAVLGILAMLLSLLFNPNMSHAQTSASGTVVAWGCGGYYNYGQCDVPAGLTGVTAISASNHNLALKADGTVVAWGENSNQQTDVPAGLSGVIAIAAGPQHSLALKNDGTVVAWGNNTTGQSSVPAGLSGVIAIAAGGYHNLALKGDGTVVAWGADWYGETDVPAGLSGVIAISAGTLHSLALKADGTVVAWGENTYGQSSVPAGLSGVIAIDAGHVDNLALKSDGTVVAWGSNSYGQSDVPAGLSGVIAISASSTHSLALLGDGTAVAWGGNESGQISLPAGLSDVTAISAGAFHNLALISTTVPGPDLTITQVADQATVSTGDPMGFTITVTNNGVATANIVTLSDTLPVYSEFSWSVSGTDAAACVLTGGALSCNFGDMPPGAVKTIRLTAPEYVYYGKCFSPIITSTATLMAYNQPVNKTATASVTVLCPYAYLDLWSDTYNVMAGDPVSYTVTIGNQGDGNAKDVEAFLDLQTPSGMSWVITEVTPSSAASNCALELDGTWTELTCLFDQITPQEEVIIKFTSPTTSESCGTFGAAGGMRASNFVGFKTKGYYLTVNCPVAAPDLAITQVADQATVSTGDPVGFTITVTNNGATANNVTLSDTLPISTGISWSVSGTDAGSCAITAGMLSCNFGDMPPNAVKTIRLTSPTQISPGKCSNPTLNNTATVMAYNQPESRSATATTTVLCPNAYALVSTDTPSVTAGDSIRFTYEIHNIGDGMAKDLELDYVIPNNPGISWTLMDSNPADASSHCSFESGSMLYLVCKFDQLASQGTILLTITSPTTKESCGLVYSAGSLVYANGPGSKDRGVSINVLCPVGDIIPVITAQPQDQALYAGDTVSFSAAASGNPAPSLQWQISTDSGTTWTDIAGATTSPLSFTTSFDQNGNQYRAVFTNIAGSANSNAATLSVSKKSATVTLANLYRPYEGQPIAATVITDPAGLSVVVTYDGSPDAPTAVGSYPVVATINDATYLGSASGTLTIQKRPAYVTPYDAYKFYGTEGPQLSGFLVNFVASDGVTATYSRTPGETVGDYTIIGSLSPNEKLANYNITYHTRTFTIKPRLVTVMADATTKVAGELDPPLTYRITSGSLAFSDTFSGVLTREPGESAGTYAIRQGTLALDSNYTLTYVGADLTILPTSINTAPTANPGESYLSAVNTAIQFAGSFSWDPENDPLTYAWTFGDGATGTGVTPTHSYTAPGVYNICLTVNDGSLDSVQACTLAVVYDPSAGFVTGGGSINSPAGAYKADETLVGKATFGFVSKYQKGARVPTGTTAFAFDLAGLSFSSQSYEWLVVNKTSNNAQFKGSGLINGTADPNGKAYNFMLWAADGSPDTFRIRIWWEDAAGEHVVYDNGVAQAIGSGNIVVHVSK